MAETPAELDKLLYLSKAADFLQNKKIDNELDDEPKKNPSRKRTASFGSISQNSKFLRSSTVSLNGPRRSTMMNKEQETKLVELLEKRNEVAVGKLVHALNTPARNWAMFEFFYSGIDRPYFTHNPFIEALKEQNLDHITKATRIEWNEIKKTFGSKPRRMSPSFLFKERTKLMNFRNHSRFLQEQQMAGNETVQPKEERSPQLVNQQLAQSGGSEVPAIASLTSKHNQGLLNYKKKSMIEGPSTLLSYVSNSEANSVDDKNRFLYGETLPDSISECIEKPPCVGQVVTAYCKGARLLQRGRVLSTGRNYCYHIQFDRGELGCEVCEDVNLVCHGRPTLLQPLMDKSVPSSSSTSASPSSPNRAHASSMLPSTPTSPPRSPLPTTMKSAPLSTSSTSSVVKRYDEHRFLSPGPEDVYHAKIKRAGLLFKTLRNIEHGRSENPLYAVIDELMASLSSSAKSDSTLSKETTNQQTVANIKEQINDAAADAWLLDVLSDFRNSGNLIVRHSKESLLSDTSSLSSSTRTISGLDSMVSSCLSLLLMLRRCAQSPQRNISTCRSSSLMGGRDDLNSLQSALTEAEVVNAIGAALSLIEVRWNKFRKLQCKFEEARPLLHFDKDHVCSEMKTMFLLADGVFSEINSSLAFLQNEIISGMR